jgi:hypothetical protein
MGLELHVMLLAEGGSHGEAVAEQVQVDGEASTRTRRHERGGEPTSREVQRRVPPVVEQGCARDADLADDLQPG